MQGTQSEKNRECHFGKRVEDQVGERVLHKEGKAVTSESREGGGTGAIASELPSRVESYTENEGAEMRCRSAE